MTVAQGVKDYIGPLKFGDWHVGQLQWNRVKKVLFGNVPNFAFMVIVVRFEIVWIHSLAEFIVNP